MNIDSHDQYNPDLVSDAGKLPYPDECADAVAAIHLLEHLYPWEAEEVLLDWKRVLKPGGKIVVELPCMDKVFSYITDCLINSKSPVDKFGWWALWGNPEKKDPGMMHRYGYSAHSCHKLLEKAGFREIAFLTPKYHIKLRDMRFEAVK